MLPYKAFTSPLWRQSCSPREPFSARGAALADTFVSRMLCAQAVARLTGDNVVLLLRVRGAEEAAAAASAERDMLRLAVEERRGPWFDQARPVYCPVLEISYWRSMFKATSCRTVVLDMASTGPPESSCRPAQY